MSLASMMRSTAESQVPVARAAPAPPVDKGETWEKLSDGAEQLARYIPTEVVTLYVALLAAQIQAEASDDAKWIAFWVMLGITPLVALVLFFIKLKSYKQPIPWNPFKWPGWKLAAASVAFTAWAFALPESPFNTLDWYADGAYNAPVLLGTTIVLGWIGALFDPIDPTP